MIENLPHGFPGQRMVVIPRAEVARALASPLLDGLVPTDVGVFPAAARHVRARPYGAPEAVLIACLRGSGSVTIGGRAHSVTSGTLVGIPPDAAHSYSADEVDPWTISWIHLAGRLALPWCQRLGFSPAKPLRPLSDRVRWTARQGAVLDQLEHGYGEPQLLGAAAAATNLLAGLLATSDDPGDPIARALLVMDARAHGSVTVAELAAAANLSPSHFAARFRAAVGVSPLEHFHRRKMADAAHLLTTTEWSIRTIAERLGYDDQFYFSRRFRAVHGISPQRFRADQKIEAAHLLEEEGSNSSFDQ